MKKIAIILLLISCFAFSQTELLPTIAWQTKVSNVEQLTDSTYKFDVMPIDWNEPGAATMQYGNYFQDYAGNTYEVIDSAYLSVTVWDIFETGVSPQVNQVGIIFDAPFDAEYLAPIRYQVLDQSALDNARARELAYLWKEASLYSKDSSDIIKKSGLDTINLTDLDSTGFSVDTGQVRGLGDNIADTDFKIYPMYPEMPKHSWADDSLATRESIGNYFNTIASEAITNVSFSSAGNGRWNLYRGKNLNDNSAPVVDPVPRASSTIEGFMSREHFQKLDTMTVISEADTARWGTVSSISGTEGYLSKFGVSGLTESVVFEDASGKVGIGTSLPDDKVHVISNANSRQSLKLTNTSDGISAGIGIEFENDETDVNLISFFGSNHATAPNGMYFKNSGKDGEIRFVALGGVGFGIGGSYAAGNDLFINNNGNVGIGTTSPTEKLDVNGNIKADTGKFDEVYVGASNIRDTLHIDRANWIEFVERYGANLSAYWDSTKSKTEFIVNAYESNGQYIIQQGDNYDTLGVKIPSIGDRYAGGDVFFVHESGTWGMCAYPLSLPASRWAPTGYTPNYVSPPTQSSFNSGKTNTANIINYYSSLGTYDYAAYMCDTLNANGYSDWYLPSLYEMDSLYVNLINGYGGTSYYGSDHWTSSEAFAGDARYVTLSNGVDNYTFKYITNYVVPIRTFSIPAEPPSTGGGNGTVTSVGIGSSDFNVSGSPITTSGVITLNLANASVDYNNLNNNIISGQTAITSGILDTDELLLSDGGTLKRMDASVFKSYIGTGDSYNHWKLYTNDTYRSQILSGNILNLKAGTNMTIGYSATNNTLTFNSIGGSGATNLSTSYASTTVTVNSDTGNDATINTANSSTAGVLSTTLYNNIIANNAKVTNATHTGEVTGSTALTIANNVVDAANLKASNSPTNTYVPSYNSSTGGFTWIANAGSGATNLSTTYSSTNVTVNSDTGNDATINSATTSNAGVMSAADKTKLNKFRDPTPQSITTSASLSTYVNFYTTASSNKTITFSNIFDGATGNIRVSYSSASVITFAASGYTINIASNIHNSGDAVLSKSSGVAIYSYYVTNSNIYINGTQSYN